MPSQVISTSHHLHLINPPHPSLHIVLSISSSPPPPHHLPLSTSLSSPLQHARRNATVRTLSSWLTLLFSPFVYLWSWARYFLFTPPTPVTNGNDAQSANNPRRVPAANDNQAIRMFVKPLFTIYIHP